MSLLNNVLRDLEQRRDADVPEQTGVAGVAPVPAGSKTRGRLLGLLVALVAAGAAAAMLSNDLPGFWRASSVTSRPAPKVAVIPAVSAPVVAAVVPPPGTAAVQEAAVLAAPSAPQKTPGELRLADEIVAPIGAGGAQPEVPSPAHGTATVRHEGAGGHSDGSKDVAPTRAAAAPVPARAAPAAIAAIEVSPRPPDVRERARAAVESGLLAMGRNQHEQARRAFSDALQWDPANDRARQALLSAVLAEGDKQTAEKVADEGVLSATAKTGFALVSARLKLERGAAIEALAVLERERAAGAAHADYLALWGNALARVGRHGEAARQYAAAVEIAPENPAHQIGLGYALRNDGQYASAQAVFQSVALMPGLSTQLAELVEQQLSALRRLTAKR